MGRAATLVALRDFGNQVSNIDQCSVQAVFDNRNHSAMRYAVPTPPAKHANTRLTLGNFLADVLISKTGEVSCHYVVQRVGSAEIIETARFHTFSEAELAAKDALQHWHLRDQQFPHQESKAS